MTIAVCQKWTDVQARVKTLLEILASCKMVYGHIEKGNTSVEWLVQKCKNVDLHAACDECMTSGWVISYILVPLR